MNQIRMPFVLVIALSFLVLGCSGEADNSGEKQTYTYYKDADQDGYGDMNASKEFAVATDGSAVVTGDDGSVYVENDDDCNDTAASANPGSAEVCDDGLDNDCDGGADLNDSDCGETTGDAGSDDDANSSPSTSENTGSGDETATYPILTPQTNSESIIAKQEEEEETTKTIQASAAGSAISTIGIGSRESGTNDYKIDDGFLFWNGVSFDFGKNREVASIGAFLDGQAYDSAYTVSGDANVNFANTVEGKPDFKWQFWTTAAVFDSSTLKRETITKQITCKNDSDGYCENEKEIDLTGSSSSFKNWNIDDIKSGRYAFYMVLDGFKADANHGQQVGDLYARVWIENGDHQEVHAKDKDNESGTGSNGVDHRTTTGKLYLKFAINFNGEKVHDYSGEVRGTLIGIDENVWGAKWFSLEDSYGDSYGEPVQYELKNRNGLSPSGKSQIIPILYSWGLNDDKAYEYASIGASVELTDYDAATHKAALKINDYNGRNWDGWGGYYPGTSPNATKGYLLYCKDYSVCMQTAVSTSERSATGSDKSHISQVIR